MSDQRDALTRTILPIPDLEQDDHDHLISPEERFQVAMARQ
jgi:hypothetical protein